MLVPQRKNAFNLTAGEQSAYISAVTAMIADGSYATLAQIHANMSHRMHTMASHGLVSTLRFLPWHRAYLVHMEEELRRKDPNAFIPYWHWVDGTVPAWLDTFKPTINGIVNQRKTLSGPITTQARIDAVMAYTNYNDFTLQLEVDPHNQGHNLLGLPMRNPRLAPYDPIFWMHHAEVDRIWAEWQARNPGLGPLLTGNDAIMDPWTDTVTSLASISALGYSYV
jgi:tyrosinase